MAGQIHDWWAIELVEVRAGYAGRSENSVDQLLQDVRDDKDLKPAYDLATSLILRGHAAAKFSGRTLKQWNATLRSPSAGIGERRVAKAAILGLAAQIVREWLDVELTIRFE